MFLRLAVSTLSALLVLSSPFAHADSEAVTIVGGNVVTDSDPDGASTVAIAISLEKGQAICTGSLIATDILVTAAHCVTSERGNVVTAAQLTLVFAGDVRSPKRILVKAAGVRRHPGYDPQAGGKDQNDIAIIRFAGGLPTGFRVASLLPVSAKIQKGSPTVLIGYGVNTMAGGGSGAGILRKVTATVADGRFAKTEVLIDQRSGKGACHGDSGGPAFTRKNGKLLLWGVTNRGNPDNAPDDCIHFAVYSRISTQASFINSATRSLRGAATLAAR